MLEADYVLQEMVMDFLGEKVKVLALVLGVNYYGITVKQVSFLDIKERGTTEVIIVSKELISNLVRGNFQVGFRFQSLLSTPVLGSDRRQRVVVFHNVAELRMQEDLHPLQPSEKSYLDVKEEINILPFAGKVLKGNVN